MVVARVLEVSHLNYLRTTRPYQLRLPFVLEVSHLNYLRTKPWLLHSCPHVLEVSHLSLLSKQIRLPFIAFFHSRSISIPLTKNRSNKHYKKDHQPLNSNSSFDDFFIFPSFKYWSNITISIHFTKSSYLSYLLNIEIIRLVSCFIPCTISNGVCLSLSLPLTI